MSAPELAWPDQPTRLRSAAPPRRYWRSALVAALTMFSCAGSATNPDTGTQITSLGGTSSVPSNNGQDAGGLGGNGAGCSPLPMNSADAKTLYVAYAFSVQPTLNPATTFGVEEVTVTNLWQNLQAQLFNAKAYSSTDGSLWRESYFVVRACQITMPTGCPLTSGVVVDSAFYYTWDSGSGIFRSQIGKLTWNGNAFVSTISPAYMNPSSGPPGIVVESRLTGILAARAATTAFNVWTAPEALGWVHDFGDHVAIVDNSGNEIPTTLP